MRSCCLILPEFGCIRESGAIEVVCNFALTACRPLATQGLHFKNYLLYIEMNEVFTDRKKRGGDLSHR
jgi:hypothetical protein